MYNFFPEIHLLDFFFSYWRFLLIVGMSFFIRRSLRWDTEKSRIMLRNWLVIGNFYLFLHLFFRPILNIEPALFILLALFVWGMIWVAQQDRNWKKKRVLCLIGGFFSIGILISGFFYLYSEAPDVEGFIAKQEKKLIITSPISQPKTEAYLLLQPNQNWKKQDILFNIGKQEFLLPSLTEIDFISKEAVNSGQAFILFENGNLLEIYPQKQIVIDNGTITWFQTIDLMTWFFTHSLLLSYIYDLQKYLEQQIGSPFVQLSFFHQINQGILWRLSYVFPGFFATNKENAQLFNYFFSLSHEDSSLLNQGKYHIEEKDSGFFSLFEMFFTNAKVFNKIEGEYCITKRGKC